MNLNELLSEKKQAVLKKWFDSLLETYPQDTAIFLKTQKDQFANPVGSTIYSAMDSILAELIKDADADIDKLSRFFDNIIRIRAVQDFSPSQALAFVISLKRVVREELADAIGRQRLADELLTFERKIDNLMLLSFDIYMKCREKIYDLKANELRNMTSKLLERANRIFEAHCRGADFKEAVLQSNNKSERGE